MGQYFTCDMKEIEVAELQGLYKKFVLECPSGGLCLHEFKQFFAIDGQSEASEYAERAFQSFDRNRVSFIFQDTWRWIMCMRLTGYDVYSSRTAIQKWSFLNTLMLPIKSHTLFSTF